MGIKLLIIMTVLRILETSENLNKELLVLVTNIRIRPPISPKRIADIK